jgi:hypothetical protein
MFEVGDRVRLVQPDGWAGREAVGTVVGFSTLNFAATTDAPDDVLVRWDSGIQLPHTPTSLMSAPGED